MRRPTETIGVFAEVVRTTRIRLRCTQRELGRRSGIAQSRISLIERRLVADLHLREIEALCTALQIEYRLDFRTPDVLSRPADLVHGRCSAYAGRRLANLGWKVAREVEVSTGNLRGWIDLLAFDERTGRLLIVEVKTELRDLGAIERTIGWYERAASRAAAPFGWRPRTLGAALLVLQTEVNDRAIQANRDLLATAFPFGANDLRRVLDGADSVDRRYLAMIDPTSTAQRWLRASRLERSRLRAPFVDYIDAVRRLERPRG